MCLSYGLRVTTSVAPNWTSRNMPSAEEKAKALKVTEYERFLNDQLKARLRRIMQF